MAHDHDIDEVEEHDSGLSHDLPTLDTDMVFSDGYSLQLAKVTGDVTNGYTATLNVPV